jgi:hypothetical protein
MLKAERKKVRKDGIVLYKSRYWAPELVDYALQPVIIRYDYNDLSSIMVYDLRSRIICEAELREPVNGLAFLSEDPLDYKKVKEELKVQRQLFKMGQKVAKMTVMRASEGVEQELAKHQAIIDGRMDSIRKHNPLFKNPPMMPPPQKRYDVNEDVMRLEEMAKEVAGGSLQVAVSEDDGEIKQPEVASTKVISLDDLMKEEEGELAGTVSFSEMQKIIGIER